MAKPTQSEPSALEKILHPAIDQDGPADNSVARSADTAGDTPEPAVPEADGQSQGAHPIIILNDEDLQTIRDALQASVYHNLLGQTGQRAQRLQGINPQQIPTEAEVIFTQKAEAAQKLLAIVEEELFGRPDFQIN